MCQFDEPHIAIIIYLRSYVYTRVWMMKNPFVCLFAIDGHEAIDRNPGPGYNTLLLRLITADLYGACPHRQFHSLPSL